METWNRLRNLGGKGKEEREEINQRTYIRVYIAHGHRQQGSEGGKEGEDICNTTIKIEFFFLI